MVMFFTVYSSERWPAGINVHCNSELGALRIVENFVENFDIKSAYSFGRKN